MLYVMDAPYISGLLLHSTGYDLGVVCRTLPAAQLTDRVRRSTSSETSWTTRRRHSRQDTPSRTPRRRPTSHCPTHATTVSTSQHFLAIFTARCYASAVLAMALCPSVRPSQVRVLPRRLNESSWFLACELPSTRPTLC